MTIQWGSWSYAGGNGLRLGIEVLNDGTINYYLNSQYSYSGDVATISYSGAYAGASDGITLTCSSGAVVHVTTHHFAPASGQKYTIGASGSGFYNGSTPSASVSWTAPVTTPSTPGGLAASNITASSVHLAWNPPSDWGGSTGSYEVQVANNSSFSGASVHATSSTSNDWTSLGNNTPYWARVRAKNSSGYSAWSSAVSFTTLTAPPSTPGIPTVSGKTQTAFNLTTTPPSNWGGDDWRGVDSGRYDFQVATNSGFTANVQTANSGDTVASFTGETANTTYWYRARAKNDAGYSPWTSARSLVTLPNLPAAPTGVTVARVSDTQHTVSWTDANTADAPYTGVRVLRSTDGAAPVTLTTISGTTTLSYSDTSTVADHSYVWYVEAFNDAGSTRTAGTAAWQTTPAAPTSLVISKTNAGDVQGSWVNNTRLGATTDIEVQHSTDNINWSTVATLADGTLTTWVYTNPGISSHLLRVRAVSTAGATTRSAWATSNTISTNQPPAAPTNLSPSGVIAPLNKDRLLQWQHNPMDASPQSGFEVQHRVVAVPANPWNTTGHLTSDVSSWTLPAGTYANGQQVEWQVRTWGQLTDAASASPWSASATITGAADPTASITSPADASTVHTSDLPVQWAYYQEQGYPQAAWRVQLWNADRSQRLGYASGAGDTGQYTFTGLEFNQSYRVDVDVMSGTRQWATTATSSFSVTYPPPANVNLAAEFDQTTGAITLYLTPDSYDGVNTVQPIGVYIERDLGYGYERLNEEAVDPSAAVLDTQMPVNGSINYRAVSVSSIPSTAYGPVLSFNPGEGRWSYLSVGQGFGVVVRVKANVKPSTATGLDVALQWFEGRELPVPMYGTSVTDQLKITGELDPTASSADDWRAVFRVKGPHLWRDPTGRVFVGALSSQLGVDEQSTAANWDRIDFTMTRTG